MNMSYGTCTGGRAHDSIPPTIEVPRSTPVIAIVVIGVGNGGKSLSSFTISLIAALLVNNGFGTLFEVKWGPATVGINWGLSQGEDWLYSVFDVEGMHSTASHAHEQYEVSSKWEAELIRLEALLFCRLSLPIEWPTAFCSTST